MNRLAVIGVLAVTALSVLLACGERAEAGPVTLRFEATISKIVVRGVIEHPTPISVGDKLGGSFTFQPRDVDPPPPISHEGYFQSPYSRDSIAQPFALSLEFSGVTLHSNEYVITSVDNQPVQDGPPSLNSDFLIVGSPVWEPSPGLQCWVFTRIRIP